MLGARRTRRPARRWWGAGGVAAASAPGRAFEFDERRFLTREQLARLLGEIPDDWQPLVQLLATTGQRISEAIALRVTDADLDAD